MEYVRKYFKFLNAMVLPSLTIRGQSQIRISFIVGLLGDRKYIVICSKKVAVLS